MLDLAILGLLQGQELHGYEIRRQLRDRLGLWANISFGSLYPALARLERTGAVSAVSAPPSSPPSTAPPTGSLSGEWAVFRARRRDHAHRRRGRKVYRITDEGVRLFGELLAAETASDDARGFALRWSFARHLTPPARRRLLAGRRDQLTARRGAVLDTLADPELDPYARSAVEHTAEALEQDVAWIDRLIAAEGAPVAAGAHDDTQRHSKEST